MSTTPPAIRIRPRREEDLVVLEQVLAAQQPTSRYPLRWPLPFPVREFIVRPDELVALVVEDAGRVVGHVSVTAVLPGELGEAWAAGAGRPIDELSCLSVLFVDLTVRGRRVGGALMDAAEDWIFARGRTAVLDVVTANERPLAVYRHRGWSEIGHARPDWLPDTEPPVILMAKSAPAVTPAT
ncbi:GNAT family N-acetyltransferase [Allobranchiibius sp. GilTou73]|uniref:GNAT family N-acetyltransferase n=1 Tax=Allobranchiibius sp. GilTou73 TaxID=2904523 RepID=UPI001F161003|nr:GNAT family N-acetyltransferase [Allobranchiibius sp. GilTou73]UIJ34089.1 GNAT family N-acetyltransferase [Allobranchiibius sp. GilTou73]